jgi:glyoxylase-like metal-dependent hydrolase (beta-lactamase superfamily II)
LEKTADTLRGGRWGTAYMEVAPAVIGYRSLMVNVCFIGGLHKQTSDWILVDAALSFSKTAIQAQAKRSFAGKPQAIVLTHGHFDHVGAVESLSQQWDVPVYAHEEELPFLNGESDYPPPDPTVGGGWMTRLSPFFPRKGIRLGSRLRPLPRDGSLPFLPEWRWIHTPGHTSGHISLYREADGVLIAGDAFTTVKQESLWSVWTQQQEIHGPPAYFTTDWVKAEESVKRLAQLHPRVAITGHGIPMVGERLARSLQRLRHRFQKDAVPKQGRYVQEASIRTND